MRRLSRKTTALVLGIPIVVGLGTIVISLLVESSSTGGLLFVFLPLYLGIVIIVLLILWLLVYSVRSFRKQ